MRLAPHSHSLSARNFRFYFTPLTGVLFTFPSRYLFTIGHQLIFSLGGWSPQIPTGFHVPCGTQDTHKALCRFAYRTITVFGRPFQSFLLQHSVPYLGPTTTTLTLNKYMPYRTYTTYIYLVLG